MNDENIVKLHANHPNVFTREVEPQCADGWFDLIDTACHLISHRLKSHPDVAFNLLQIKEKFGTMSFYYSGGDEYIRGVVNHAMAMSGHICEISGDAGTTHITSRGWIRTVSPAVAKDRDMVPYKWDL
jgi:hypothetical protein